MDKASALPDTEIPMPDVGAVECSVARALPRATVFIPVRNNERYVRATMRSVLVQWQPYLDLIVLDDGSTDGSFEAVREVLAEYPDVAATLIRNPRTLGVASLPCILAQTRAPIIIQADSDDISLPGRIAAIMASFEEDPSCRLVTTNAVLLSETGIPIGVYDQDAASANMDEPAREAARTGSSGWLGATSAYHRDLLEAFPVLDPELCPYGLDLLLPFRATLLGTHRYLAQPSIGWRQHPGNSHKLAGAPGNDDKSLERHGAFSLMVQAQKIRDLQALADSSDRSERLAPVYAAAQQTFLEYFAHWCRVRSRLEPIFRAGGPPARLPDHASPSPVGIPPLATLRHGERRDFGAVEDLGIQVQAWDGIYGPEALWNWTARTAVLAFNWPENGPGTVTIGLVGSVLPIRHVLFSVNLGAFRAIAIDGADCVVSLPIEKPHMQGVLSIVVHVPDAVRPSDISSNPDARCLGVQLRFIEARRRDGHAS